MNLFKTELSVIILTYPSDLSWTKLLADLSLLSSECEVILVGAKSEPDAFQKAIQKLSLKERPTWLQAAPNRAAQINLAAQKSQKKFIWLLNSDCRVTSTALASLEGALQKAPDVIHYFDLEFSGDGPGLSKLNSLGSWLRSRTLKLPFGNQGLCFSKEAFDRVGGFDESLDSNETSDFICRAKLKKIKIKPINSSLLLSSKKYLHDGWGNLTLQEVSNNIKKTLPLHLHYLKKKWIG